jgi:hypothetical protein
LSSKLSHHSSNSNQHNEISSPQIMAVAAKCGLCTSATKMLQKTSASGLLTIALHCFQLAIEYLITTRVGPASPEGGCVGQHPLIFGKARWLLNDNHIIVLTADKTVFAGSKKS